MNRRDFLKSSLLAAPMVSMGDHETPVVREEKSFSHDGRVLRMPWSGLTEPARLCVIGDTHLSLCDARDADHEIHCFRMGGRSDPKKKAEIQRHFTRTLARAGEGQVDLIVLVGDIVSFPSLANVEFVRSSLDACGVPWIYVAGNHDWHFEGEEGSDLAQRERWTKTRLAPLYQGENPLMSSRMVKGVRVVMIDNSAYHVLPEQVTFWRQEAAKGDPVCLCMHIPFWQPGWDVTTCACPEWGSATDPYWRIERRQRWADRLMPSTFAFREAVLSTPNLVGVFAGHEHVDQFVRDRGQNLFTVAANRTGAALFVEIGGSAPGARVQTPLPPPVVPPDLQNGCQREGERSTQS